MRGKIKINHPTNKTTSFQNREAFATFICGIHCLNNENKGATFQYLKYFEDNVLKKNIKW